MEEAYTFVWRIENFSYCFPRTGDSLKSPTFSFGHFPEWSVRLFPRGRRKPDRIDVRLEREDNSEVDVELTLLDASGRPLHGAQRAAACSVPREEVLRRGLPDDVLSVRARVCPGDRTTVVATTVVRVERWTLPLTVEGFSDFEKDAESVTTVRAACRDCPGFRIKVCPERDGGDGHVAIRIAQDSHDRDNLARCRMMLLARNGSVVAAAEDEQWFHRYRLKQPWNFPPFVSRESLLKNKLALLPNDTLWLRIEMSVSLGEWKTTGPKPANKTASESASTQTESVPSGALQSDLKSLYLEKSLCDFTLTAGSKSFSVHKSLLAARSPVFKAMFLKGMVKDSLTIRDTDPETMELFLNFAYGEELEDLDWPGCVKLYSAADKYHLLPLKEACKVRLKAALDASNAWDLLLLADRHQDEDLRETVQRFILEREKSITALEEEGEALLNLHQVYLKLSPASKTASNV